jgi:hypothetical protein
MTIRDDQVLQRSADGTAQGLPMGGPYTVEGAQNVYVGDLWVLAGQSNMEGVGDLTDVETPSPFVHSYQSREEWAIAEEPLHWLGESPPLSRCIGFHCAMLVPPWALGISPTGMPVRA